MPQTLQAHDVGLDNLIETFGLERIDDDGFFPEWQTDLPAISDFQGQQLQQIQAGYLNLLNHPPLVESTVRMAVLDPLLFVGEFYLAPFFVKAEESIELKTEDEAMVIRGRIDTLVLREQLWIMVIESKRASYSIEVGLAPILAYSYSHFGYDIGLRSVDCFNR